MRARLHQEVQCTTSMESLYPIAGFHLPWFNQSCVVPSLATSEQDYHGPHDLFWQGCAQHQVSSQKRGPTRPGSLGIPKVGSFPRV